MAKTFTRWLDRIFSARNPFSTWWSTRRENSFFQLIPGGIIIRIESDTFIPSFFLCLYYEDNFIKFDFTCVSYSCVKIKIHSNVSIFSVYFCIMNFYHNGFKQFDSFFIFLSKMPFEYLASSQLRPTSRTSSLLFIPEGSRLDLRVEAEIYGYQ